MFVPFELHVSFKTGEQLQRFANNKIQKNQTQLHFTNLSLKDGKRYFATVRAFNKAGLFSSVTSDGITVDRQPPRTGVVYDGTGKI